MVFDLATFTAIHTAISIVAIVAGLFAVYGLFTSAESPFWSGLFLVTAILTSLTGFGFPFSQLLPSHVVGLIALIVLAVVLLARFVFRNHGAWRWIYASGMVISLYFLVFVAIAQAFAKIPALRATAPTQSELPFALTQGLALVLFIALAIAASRTFRPQGWAT
jgi:hypothetical protein